MTLPQFLTEQLGLTQAEKTRTQADHAATIAQLDQRITDLQHLIVAANNHPQIEVTIRTLNQYALVDDAVREL